MKKNNVLCLCVVLMLAVGANAQTVSDTQNSGCLSHTRGAEDEQVPTIVLKKEGNILSVEVQNFISNCATSDFVVNSSIDEGGDCDPWTLTINVIPVLGELLADCVCPFNVTSTIRNIERNHFYLDCWWYQGYVELKDGEPLVLEDVREDVTIGGVNYSLRKALHHAMLKKSEWERELHIPFEVNYEGQTYSVISIDKDAFRDNTTLTKVTIPHTIKNLGFDAAYGFYMNPFIGCTALESIEVDEVNPVVCSIEGVLFNKEKTKLLCFPAAANCTSYTVPEGVTWIEGCAFMNNRNLVNVTLPDGVATLGSSAFYGCESLEEVKLSNSLQGLGSWTFGNCRHLKSVTIPEGVTFLGTSLFSGCTNLTSVTMPESITSIDYAVFENCTSLKSITLSPNLDQIEQKLFLNCNSLTEIQIPKGVTWVRSSAFQGCTSLKTVDLPESVYGLGNFLFSGCQLESLYIRGVIDFSFSNHYYLFDGMGTQTNVYVLPTEVEKFKTIYNGPIYPLSEQANGIFDISNPSINTSDFFDLQGRRLKYPSAKGVYIQNGRKQIKH